MSGKSESLEWIHGEPGQRFFQSQLSDEVMEGSIEHFHAQYNPYEDEFDIRVVLLLDEGDRYTVAVFLDRGSDPDDFNSTFIEETEESFDSLPEAITCFGEQAIIASTQDNDEALARRSAMEKITDLRRRFGITPPPMRF